MSMENLLADWRCLIMDDNMDATRVGNLLSRVVQRDLLELLRSRVDQECSVLQMLIRKNRIDAIQCILNCLSNNSAAKVDLLKSFDGYGYAALHLAVQNYDIFSTLLLAVPEECRFELLQMRDCHGSTLVHKAVRGKQRRVLALILNNVPQDKMFNLLQKKTDEGVTPLHTAIDDADIFRLLINALPEHDRTKALSIRSDALDAITPVEAAIKARNPEVIKVLLDFPTTLATLMNIACGDNSCVLWLAASENCVELIQKYFESISNRKFDDMIILTDINGRSVLHASAKHFSMIKCFLQRASNQDTQLRMLGKPCKKGDCPIYLIAESSEDSLRAVISLVYPSENITVKDFFLRMNNHSEQFLFFKAPKVLVLYTTSGRPGAEEEKSIIYNAFGNIGIEAEVKKDLNKDKWLEIIRTVKQDVDISVLIIVVMCHGDTGCLADAEGQLLELQQIITELEFPKNPNYPKVLFVQACQGHHIPLKEGMSHGSDQGPFDANPNEQLKRDFHQKTRDFLLAMSTIPGDMAKRGYFITKFAELMCDSDKHLLDMLTEVGNKMKQDSQYDQVPVFLSTLSQKLRFRWLRVRCE